MYFPKVSYPYSSNNNVNMLSGEYQTPFFFGGSQVPTDLFYLLLDRCCDNYNLYLMDSSHLGSGKDKAD